MIDREAYITRIGNASPAQLVVISFELIIDALKEAIAVCGPEADSQKYYDHVSRARNGLLQLMSSLNLEVPLSYDFYELYRYADQVLANASFKPSPEAPEEVMGLMETLLKGWRVTADEADKKESSLTQQKGRPQTFAGLTYNRSGELEEYVTEEDSREFKA